MNLTCFVKELVHRIPFTERKQPTCSSLEGRTQVWGGQRPGLYLHFFALFPVCGMGRKERIALENNVSSVYSHIIDVVMKSVEITGCSRALDKRTL